MKVLIDACVLYPTVMREIVLNVAAKGLFAPFWSARILEEWALAAARLGASGQAVARGEIAVLRAQRPLAEIAPDPEIEARLWLPDSNDIHVLAAAISAKADIILTLNLRDFPAPILAEHQLTARHPDALLRDLLDQAPQAVSAAVEDVRQTAERLSGESQPVRKLLKKARLPRLGKALDEGVSGNT